MSRACRASLSQGLCSGIIYLLFNKDRGTVLFITTETTKLVQPSYLIISDFCYTSNWFSTYLSSSIFDHSTLLPTSLEMNVSFFVSTALLATLAMVEAGPNPGGSGGDTKGGAGGRIGPTGPGGRGDKAGGATAGGSTATGPGGTGGGGGKSFTGAGGSGGGSTTNAGVTYVFEDAQFGPSSAFGGPTGITGGRWW